MVILAFSTNKTLMSHVVAINQTTNLPIFGTIRKNSLNFFFDIFKFRCFKNTTIFIYNISPTNLLSSVVSKLYSCKIVYHLHDPKPHSGVLNPFIYLLQFIQVTISDSLLVYDEALINDTNLYYWTYKKSFHVVKHGLPDFSYVDSGVLKDKTTYGFFGRNMPYKNVFEFINLSKKYPDSNFYIFGEGYHTVQSFPKNLKINSGYINNDHYYSAMLDVDYVVIPYTDISFSGVITDSIALGKTLIVSHKVYNSYSNPNMILIDKFTPKNLKFSKQPLTNIGWKDYANSLIKIANHV